MSGPTEERCVGVEVPAEGAKPVLLDAALPSSWTGCPLSGGWLVLGTGAVDWL